MKKENDHEEEKMTVKIPSDLKKELKHICVDKDILLKELVTRFLEEGLENYQKEKK